MGKGMKEAVRVVAIYEWIPVCCEMEKYLKNRDVLEQDEIQVQEMILEQYTNLENSDMSKDTAEKLIMWLAKMQECGCKPSRWENVSLLKYLKGYPKEGTEIEKLEFAAKVGAEKYDHLKNFKNFIDNQKIDC